MDNIHSLICKHVVDSDSPKDVCDELLIFVITLRQTYVDNNKPVAPVGGN